MKIIFVAIIMVFNSQTNTLQEAGTAAFETSEQCKDAVQNIYRKAESDFAVRVEATCIETPLFQIDKK